MRLDTYQRWFELGRGGMGIVYLANHPAHGTVALKTVRKGAKAFALRSLLLEGALLSKLKHPGIVHLLEHGDGDVPWLALEFLQGDALATLIGASFSPSGSPQVVQSTTGHTKGMASTYELGRATLESKVLTQPLDSATIDPERTFPSDTGHVPEQERASPITHMSKQVSREALLGWVGQVCEALGYVHGQGLVHSDIKPDNIIVTHEGRAVLVDFGLACSFGSRVSTLAMERAGVLAGSLLYISPEQLRGEGLDARADLYALGCVLFEVLTGKPPFTKGSNQELISQHLNTPAPGLLESQAPTEVRALVASLLSKKRGDRPGHVRAVLHRLEQMGVDTRPPAVLTGELPPARPYLYKASLTGRRELLEQLRTRLNEAQQGHGRLVLLSGESGAGKTRLVLELVREARRKGDSRILLGHGATSTGRPLGIFIPILESIVDTCRQQGLEMSMRVFTPEDAAILAPLAPFIGELNGVDTTGEVATLPLQAARERLFGRLLRVFMRLSTSKPRTLVLVLDDLQWADELSLSFLRYMSKRIANHPWLVIGTVRSHQANPELDVLLTELREHVWPLEALGQEEVEQLIVQMLGQTPDLDGLKALAERANGNPFFVAEYLHMLTQRGYLTLDREGHWMLEAAQAANLPRVESTLSLAGDRLQALTTQERQLCGAAAVLGRRMRLAQLRSVVRMEWGFDATLEQLTQLRILEPASQAGQVNFVHDQLREAMYAQLTPQERVDLHHRVALSWEAREQAGEQVDLALLAWHWAQAQCSEFARQRYVEAARHAIARFALSSARQHFHEALRLFEPDDAEGFEVHLEFIEEILLMVRESEKIIAHVQTLLERLVRSSEDTLWLQARAHLAWGNAFWPRPEGRFNELREHLQMALSLAEQLGEDELAAQAQRSLGRLILSESNWSEEASSRAIVHFREALAVFEAVGDHALQAQLHHDIGETNNRLYREDDALTSYKQALALYRAHAPHAAGPTLKGLGRLLEQQLHSSQALDCFEQALTLARTSSDFAAQIFLMFSINNIHAQNGRFAQALTGYSAARRLAPRLDEARARVRAGVKAISMSEVGLFLAYLGNTTMATRLVDRSVELSLGRYGDMFSYARLSSQLNVARLRGDLDTVIELAHSVVEDLDTNNLTGRYYIGPYLMWLAHARFLRGQLDEAEALCREAIAGQGHDHFTDTGSGQAELARIMLAQGRTEEARLILERALDRMLQHDGYPLVDITQTRLYLARAYRESDELDKADQQMTHVLSNYRSMGYKVMCVVALCEQGHLALAHGVDATPWLEQATLLIRGLTLSPESYASQALSELKHRSS